MQRIIFRQSRALYSSRAGAKIKGQLAGTTKTKDEPKKRNKYSHTVLLPQTQFPMRLGGKKRIEMDEYLTEKCGFNELYEWQRENLQGPDYVLHDGPPYANGVPHMGHAINKILKDITLRNKVIRRRRVHYMPGWDCHGLPIELKVLTNIDNNDPIQIRRKARKYAEEVVQNQRRAFQSWGVIGSWKESGCYLTNQSSYIKNELHQFINLYEKGLVFRDFKPVHWSPSSRTALAESELEYNDEHQSQCAIVRLRIQKLPEKLKSYEGRKIYALTWTTTPWTLIVNQALAFSANASYCLAENTEGNMYILAEALFDSIQTKIGSLTQLTNIDGKELEGATYFHPIGGEVLPFLAGQHVTTTLGTGLVHTAPAHGPEDFLVALENNLKVMSVVDSEGRFTEATGSEFHGLEVLKEGTDKVLKYLAPDVLHVETITHSYPYDWRTKKPVIMRASYQWFLDINAIKQKAIDSIAGIEIYPNCNRKSFVNALFNQIQTRPYWCISRQRSWGTPIPVIRNKKTGETVTSRKLVSRLCHLIDQHGPDCWWELSTEELLGPDIIKEFNVKHDDIEIGKDILDIWFDSGISWSQVLPDRKADLYLEGHDQFNGWFQSSLLTSIALQGYPPYKALFVHGFAVDGNGLKMSKSVGNVVNPEDILKGGSDAKKVPVYGIDTLRWWVANHGCQHNQVPVSAALLDGCAQSVQRLRSIMRFLLGVLYPYSTDTDVEPQYQTIDKYMLYLMYRYNDQVQKYYDNYEYHHVCKTIMNFVANDVSGLYCHITKDRLYCEEATLPSRIAAIQVMKHLSTILARTVAPILPHLAEEMWLHHPENIASASLYRSSYEVPDDWNDSKVVEPIEAALSLKGKLHKIVSTNTWELSASVEATTNDFTSLCHLQDAEHSSTSELCEILQLSSVKLVENKTTSETQIQVNNIEKSLCERCRRYPESDKENELCIRCCNLVTKVESVSRAA